MIRVRRGEAGINRQLLFLGKAHDGRGEADLWQVESMIPRTDHLARQLAVDVRLSQRLPSVNIAAFRGRVNDPGKKGRGR